MSLEKTPTHPAFERPKGNFAKPTSILTTAGLVAAGITAPFLGLPAWANGDCVYDLTVSNTVDRNAIQAMIDDQTCSVVVIESSVASSVLDLTGLEPLRIDSMFNDTRAIGGFTLKSTTDVEITRLDGIIAGESYSSASAQVPSSFPVAAPILVIDNSQSSSVEAPSVVIEGLTFTEANAGAIDARDFGWDLELVDTHFVNNGGLDNGQEFFYGIVGISRDLGDSNFEYLDFLVFSGGSDILVLDLDQTTTTPSPYLPAFLDTPSTTVLRGDVAGDLFDDPTGFVQALSNSGVADAALVDFFNGFNSDSSAPNFGAVISYGDIKITGSIFTNNGGVYDGAYTPYTGTDTEVGTIASFDDFKSTPLYSGTFGIYGAVASTNGAVDAEASIFDANRGEDGGAINSPLDVNVRSSTFTNNRAEDDGGAIYTANTGADVFVESSSFTGNEADPEDSSSSGGAIYGNENVTVRLSSFDDNNAGDLGGAIYSEDDMTVRSSYFVDNDADYSGGALYSDDDMLVHSTLFSSNHAGSDGGAVKAADDFTSIASGYESNSAEDDGGAVFVDYGGVAEIHTSTFVGNSADSEGGAVYSWEYSQFFNSTFVGNASVDNGGAIHSKYGADFVNNTFIDNTDLETLDSGPAPVPSSIYEDNGNSRLFGNIFASSSDDVSRNHVIGLDSEGTDDWGGNISTSDLDEEWMADGSRVATYSQLNFEASALTLDPSVLLPNPVARVQTGSVAIDYTPDVSEDEETWLYEIDEDFDGINVDDINVRNYQDFSDYPYATFDGMDDNETPSDDTDDFPTWVDAGYTDQTGTVRLAKWDSGAHEFGVGTPLVLGGGINSTPAVIEVNPSRITTKKETVTVFGAHLKGVRSIIINGKSVKIESQSNDRITFRAPSGLVGTHDLILVLEAGLTFPVKSALTYSGSVADGARTLVPGFAANSTVLSDAMKKQIRKFLKQNPDATSATCKGFTSAPATRQDSKLARQRGKAACEYMRTIRPDLTVKFVKGEHTEQPGQSIRRVRISLR